MNENKLYIDSYYDSLGEATKNAKEFSKKNKSQYYHIIPTDDDHRFKVSRYYDSNSIGCYFRGAFIK